MGAFFTNLQVRNATTEAICAALPSHTNARAYVSPQTNGWVTVYTEATEDQNDKTLRAIAGGLSQSLQADVLAFLVHDSDIAAYWLYRNGTPTDEFDSAPDYFGQRVDEKTRAHLRGNTDALLPLCVAGTTREQLDAVLHPPDGSPTFAEEIVTDLARLLGIDDARVTLGFNYFDEEGADTLPDAAEFEPVGRGAERKEPEPDDDDDSESGPTIPVPDAYPMAIGMLTMTWSEAEKKNVETFAKMMGPKADAMLKQMRAGFDKAARDMLKKSLLRGLPEIEELTAARDQGPDSLAALIAKKTPLQLAEIGIVAAVHGQEAFLAALLKHGLDPNAANPAGRTTLDAAARHGTDSAIYQMVKAVAEGKSTTDEHG